MCLVFILFEISFVIGDKNGVKFRTLKNGAGHWSDATCGNVIQHSKGLGPHGSSYYTAPCEVNAAKGDQVVQVQCLNPKNPKENASGVATITWYKGPTKDGQRSYGIHVASKGNIWLGTSLSSEASTPLIQRPFSLGGLKNEAVIINCNNNNRS